MNDPALADAIARLTAASQQAVAPFFATYPELRPLYAAYVASTDPLPARRTALLAAFLPVLKTRRKQEQALASSPSAAGSDPSFASELLTGAAVMHADADATAPAVTDLTAIEQQDCQPGSSSATTLPPRRTFRPTRCRCSPTARPRQWAAPSPPETP